MKRIMKHALLVIKNNKILLNVEKKQKLLLLPGGKPIKGENYLQCLKREIKEELNAEISTATLKPLGRFEDIAADNESIITVYLYLGELKTKPKPCNEVKRIVWFGAKNDPYRLSPVIRNKIMPYLKAVRLIK
ncbi:NUDIX domain-containing protein [Candidatus Woesearchaeota archaeon]|nr:NUDIX domain-containing protein [Candidatus Woesearchaeota archaeon]